MSTTKLPEAFAKRHVIGVDLDVDDPDVRFADGYNSALEATGARELWGALSSIESTISTTADPIQLAANLVAKIPAIRDVLRKSNPSNTVG